MLKKMVKAAKNWPFLPVLFQTPLFSLAFTVV